jgi:hypothetical protein
MKYEFPDLKNSSLAYKGRRFWIIEIEEEDTFYSDITKDDGDYIFYDALYHSLYGEGFIAVISKSKTGEFITKPLSTHVDMSFKAQSLREVVKRLPSVMEGYLTTCHG